MITEKRNTLSHVPRQSRSRMVVKSFRIPEAAWDKLVARCEREDLNPTEVVRELAVEWAEEEDE